MATDKPTIQTPDDYIPTWDEIGHLLERGQVAEVYYDTETVDTSRKFNAILDLGLATTDLAGRVVDTLEVDARVPDNRIMSPRAALVNRRGQRDWDRGVSQQEMAGRMADALRRAPLKVFDELTDEEVITPITSKGYRPEETVRKLYFRDEDGEVKHARLHQGGKYVSIPIKSGRGTYTDPDGQQWKRMRSSVGVNHFYGIRADDPWMWSAFDTAGMPDIFLTHTRKSDARQVGAFRTDIHKLAQMVYLYGPDGEQGLQTLENGMGGRSFRLEDLMNANTRNAVPERGIEDGVRMPDGSQYNDKKGHKRALVDALAVAGFKSYLRRIAPDVMKHAETNADFNTQREFVAGANGFDDHPVLGMGRVILGRAAGHMGMMVNLDEEYGDFKNALLIKLDTDLQGFRYHGKRLLEMSEDELVDMIKEQKRDPNALFQTEHLRKNPILVPQEMAIRAGQNNGWDPERIEENRRYLIENPVFLERAMKAWNRAQPEFQRAHEITNPLPEDELFTNVGPLPYYQVKVEGSEEARLVHRAIHVKAEDVLNNARKIDRAMRMGIETDPVEFDPEREGVLEEFKAKMELARKTLERENVSDYVILDLVHAAERAPTVEAAQNAIWDMRKGFMGRFNDFSLSYEVHDENGNQIDFQDIVTMQEHDLLNRLQMGRISIEFESIPTQPSTQKLARKFWDEGRIDDLGAEWKAYMELRIPEYLHGRPDRDPSEQDWMTGPRALEEIEELLSDPVEFEKFAAGKEDATQMLEALREAIIAKLEKFPFTDEAKVATGWDPKTNQSIPYIEYEVAAENTIVIDVPDRHLENPLSERLVADKFLMMYGPKGVNLAKELKAGKELVLRGAETGKMYLAAGATVDRAPAKGDFPEAYAQAEAGYQNSGYVMPRNNGSMLAVKVEALHPLANTRDVDLDMQSVKVPRAEDFEAMVSPTLGLTAKPLTGMVMRKYEFVPTTGPTRFQETDAEGKETGWEIEGEIKSVREMTLLELRDEIKSRKFKNADARRYGYADTTDMMAHVSHMFDDELAVPRRDRRPGSTSSETFVLVDLKKAVKPETMTYLDYRDEPEASIQREFIGDRRTSFDLRKQRKPVTLTKLSDVANDPAPAPPTKKRKLG